MTFSKKSFVLGTLAAALIAVLINLFFGRWLSVKLSTVPVLNRFRLLSPQAPIVINTREEFRGPLFEDFSSVIDSASPKISLVLAKNNSGQLTPVAGALNLTSDGIFLAPQQPLSGLKVSNLFVKLYDGSIGKISQIIIDPGFNIAIIKTDLGNVPVANFGGAADLLPGNRVVVITQGMPDFSKQSFASLISAAQGSDYSEKDSDAAFATFKLQDNIPSLPGSAVIDSKGQFVGMFDGQKVIASNFLSLQTDRFFKLNGSFSPSVFGFKFRETLASEQKITNFPEGALVTSVSPGSIAQKAGLLAGDIIVLANNKKVSNPPAFEQILNGFYEGDSLTLKITRGKDTITINLTAGVKK